LNTRASVPCGVLYATQHRDRETLLRKVINLKMAH